MFTYSHVGWTLLIGGAALSVAEGLAIADANVSGQAFSEMPIGKLEEKIPNPTPFQLGTLLLIGGALTLFVYPILAKKVKL